MPRQKRLRQPSRFSALNQPVRRQQTALRGNYWRAIPIEAFSIPTRQALASIPINRWWLELASDPDEDLDLIWRDLFMAKTIELRPDFAWQVRDSCRHLIHAARQWAKRYAIVQLMPPDQQRQFDPQFEPLEAVDEARRLHDLAFHHTLDIFPGCPAAIAKLRGLRP